MAGTPQWKRVLISGSNLEVNSLTSSGDFPVTNLGYTQKSFTFRDPSTGGWEVSSSYWGYLSSNGLEHIELGFLSSGFSPKISINVPDAGITASAVGAPIIDTSIDLINFPALFRRTPSQGGFFQQTSSIGYQPYLNWSGSQTAIFHSQMRSGSSVEGPTPAETASFPYWEIFPAPTTLAFPMTFTGSYTQSFESYIDVSNGDYIRFVRGIPSTAGITASFNLPMLLMPNGAAWASDESFDVVLRHYSGNTEALDDTGDYTEYTLEIALSDIIDASNPQYAVVPSGTSNALTGSATGDFELNGPISPGDRFQLRFNRSGTNFFYVGYKNGDYYHDESIGAYMFGFHDPVGVVEGDTFYSPQFNASYFEGEAYGAVSGSLLNVSLNDIDYTKALYKGDGLLLHEVGKSGDWISYFTGQEETNVLLRLYPANVFNTMSAGYNKSGLRFDGITEADLISGYSDTGSYVGGLELADGIVGPGLAWGSGASNKEIIQIDLDTNSGLTTATGKLKIASTLPGDGLEGDFGTGNAGSMSINLATGQSGLAFGQIGDPDALHLVDTLPGFGLNYGKAGIHSTINVDSNVVVNSSDNYITFKAGTPNAVFDAWYTSGGTGTTTFITLNNGITSNAYLDFKSPISIDRPTTNVIGDVLVQGNLTVVDSNNVTNIWADSFQTTDQFIHINSGSAGSSPFSQDNGGFIIQTSSLDGSGNASGSAIFGDFGVLGDNLYFGATRNFDRIGWGVTKGRVPWDAKNIFGNFVSQTNVGDLTSSVDYVAALATTKWGTGAPLDNDSYFIGNDVLGQTIGSFWIDSNTDPSQNDSNVYIFGLFE